MVGKRLGGDLQSMADALSPEREQGLGRVRLSDISFGIYIVETFYNGQLDPDNSRTGEGTILRFAQHASGGATKEVPYNTRSVTIAGRWLTTQANNSRKFFESLVQNEVSWSSVDRGNRNPKKILSGTPRFTLREPCLYVILLKEGEDTLVWPGGSIVLLGRIRWHLTVQRENSEEPDGFGPSCLRGRLSADYGRNPEQPIRLSDIVVKWVRLPRPAEISTSAPAEPGSIAQDPICFENLISKLAQKGRLSGFGEAMINQNPDKAKELVSFTERQERAFERVIISSRKSDLVANMESIGTFLIELEEDLTETVVPGDWPKQAL